MSGSVLDVLNLEDVMIGCEAASMEDAIRLVGGRLVERGSVEPSYIDGMLEREATVSTFLGNGVALPHGVLASKGAILTTGIVVGQFPAGVDWGAGTAHLVVGLAATGDEHVAVLSQLAEVLMDEELCDALAQTSDADFILTTLTTPVDDDEDDE
ncbi:MAG: PTS sugar transporter subunit IIA [Actinomycetota bacterium]